MPGAPGIPFPFPEKTPSLNLGGLSGLFRATLLLMCGPEMERHEHCDDPHHEDRKKYNAQDNQPLAGPVAAWLNWLEMGSGRSGHRDASLRY